MMVLTVSEQTWLDDFERLARRTPKSLALYTTDGEINICKIGVPSDVFLHTLNRRLQINAGAVLTDMHDDMALGKGDGR